ncbi:glycosyltransferase family 2 protein [Streptomyces sp. UNOC14_S4]|uniref:glycosyltransferase family 2 protein n=1 Tax=Streptomyces sp. UNOC14_S4 TaxID=2872340 RepID=UPI001E45B3D2|nr:glycosyltransferase family A protein [Streptomyces sp. UNOC14_S4]MCC3769106.1 glycosyltransferase family 2 protein [Streptomyces sp. UNOC14_S4]
MPDTTGDSSRDESRPRVGIVVPTIGRPALLQRLFASLEAQTMPVSAVVVADQSNGTETASVAAAWVPRLPVTVVNSHSGASQGRNDGLAALPACDVIAFPDDDCWYTPTTVADAIKELTADHMAVSGRLLTPDDRKPSRVRSGNQPLMLNRRSIWTHALESTCFFRREFFERYGVFNVGLGVGCPTPWQSGEGTELLWRALSQGASLGYSPRITVFDDADTTPNSAAYLRKTREYARGTGQVIRLHQSRREFTAAIARPAARGLYNLIGLRPHAARLCLHIILGRCEGYTGQLLPARYCRSGGRAT